ncbi:unnamed protein product [Adineta steineri]|uniref:Uncharacterized protein n=1 Tax=Adineta steineri TaxID=433720 RepID=A0A815BHU4_9BILA|nr:unnamed protein product [Adineta steineri]
MMLSPNYCSCTVNQARNLYDKGKTGGIDPFCIISMGKEKFATAVCEKTSSPDWHEQCDMPIVDDATIKLTVFHNNKSSLSKGDFIGRAYVSLRDLQDYDHVHKAWYKLTNKEGKLDKDRGEIEVSLQFYSKNNTTGSVFDLATKKKHLSLKDIKHSLGDKLKSASKHRRHDKYSGENQLGDQRKRLGGGDDASSSNGRDFLDDSISEKSRAPVLGLGTTLGSVTPYSSRRSVTSDYETSSILDSASMYGSDDTSAPSPAEHFQFPPPQQQQQYREVNVDDKFLPKATSNENKTKEPFSPMNVPTIITTKAPLLGDSSRSSSVTGDDIEAAFDSINDYKTSLNKSKENERSDSFFGLSTIKENLDTDENIFNTKKQADEEIDFDNCFNRLKQPVEEKKTKRTAPILQQSTTTPNTKEQKNSKLSYSNDIYTPPTSISIKADTNPRPSITLPTKQQQQQQQSETNHDSTDEDIDEIIGKLERVSSMRSSVRRKIQPRNDIMQQSFFEPDNKPINTYNYTPSSQKKNAGLPDIVVQPALKNSSPNPISKKSPTNSLSVLGYDNVKSTAINPKIRQELDYLDREELLHVIAYQTDLIKKRDTRVKDLEHYTDGLLVKIVEQCPAILQVGSLSKR